MPSWTRRWCPSAGVRLRLASLAVPALWLTCSPRPRRASRWRGPRRCGRPGVSPGSPVNRSPAPPRAASSRRPGLACAPTPPPRRRGRVVGRGRRGGRVIPVCPAFIPTGRRRRRSVRLVRRGPGRGIRCPPPRWRASRRRATRCRATRCRAIRCRPGRCRAVRRRATRSACPARAARPTYPGSLRLALGRRRHLLVGGPRHVPGSHRPRQCDPHACHASSVSRFPRASATVRRSGGTTGWGPSSWRSRARPPRPAAAR